MTITLQDVSFLTGLPIRGDPLVLGCLLANWKARLGDRFGIPVPDSTHGVPWTWLRNFSQYPPDVSDKVVKTHFIAYLLHLFGSALFLTTQGDWVYPNFVHIAESLTNAKAGAMPQYS